jgi:cation transport ATPase
VTSRSNAGAIYRFRVENLHCDACERRVRTAFADDPRITRIDVDIQARGIALHASVDGIEHALADRLTEAGFAATPEAGGTATATAPSRDAP